MEVKVIDKEIIDYGDKAINMQCTFCLNKVITTVEYKINYLFIIGFLFSLIFLHNNGYLLILSNILIFINTRSMVHTCSECKNELWRCNKIF